MATQHFDPREAAWTDEPPEPIDFAVPEPLRSTRHLNGAATHVDDATANENPVVLYGQDVHRVLADLDHALGTTDSRIYQRSNELVLVVGATPEDAKQLNVAAETPIIRTLTSPALMPRVTEHVDYRRIKKPTDRAIKLAEKSGAPTPKDERVPALPSPIVLTSFLAKPFWSHIRHIRGITETPILHLDGSARSTYGYDDATGYIVAPNAAYPAIQEHPTRDDANAALELLRKPFAEFSYETPSDKDAPIALMLTLLLRPVLPGNVPAFVNVAPQKNCGKSLLSKAACIVVTGQTPGAGTWPAEREEQEKIIGAAALAGLRVLFFDNVAEGGVIGGAPLDKLLTCDGANAFRVLGVSEYKRLPWTGVVVFTGNRAKIGGDADRRSLICNLQKPDVVPEKYEVEDLLAHVSSRRVELVVALLTLARAWVHGGSPREDVRRIDSFEQWGWTVAAMIRWAGGEDVTTCIHDGDGDDGGDEVAANEARLLEELDKYMRDNDLPSITAKEIFKASHRHHLKIEAAKAEAESNQTSIKVPREEAADPDGPLELLTESIDALITRGGRVKPSARALGDYLRGMKGVRRGALRLKAEPKKVHGAVVWTVERTEGGKP